MNKYNIPLETEELLGKIVGDTGENEGLVDVVNRIARFYLRNKAIVACYHEEMDKKIKQEKVK